MTDHDDTSDGNDPIEVAPAAPGNGCAERRPMPSHPDRPWRG